MLTLGISDTASTAALIDNGKILSIIHEERMQRIKRFVGFPKESILECLRIADISKEEINNIAIVNTNEFPIKLRTDIFEHKNLPYNIFSSRYERFLTMVFEFYRLKILNNKNINKVDSFISKKIVERKLRNLGFKDQKKYYIDHHLAHASSAFYTSNFGESLVITLDGQGNRISGTVNIGKKNEIERINEIDIFSSLGHFYGGITELLGFKYDYDENKVMALAPYGNPDILFDKLKNYFSSDKTKIIKKPPLNRYGRCSSLYLKKILDGYKKEDIAAGSQKVLEDVVCNLVSNCIDETGIRNITLAGGIFLNIKLNKSILELDNVKNVFVHPAADDSGTALGAALFLNFQLTGKKPDKFTNVYFGSSFSEDEIKKSLFSKKDQYNLKFEYIDEVEKYVGEYILPKGYLVGWFQGRMEYGPRALGNRSVLGDPRNLNIPKKIRLTFKKRPSFQPFCQSIIDKAEKNFVVNPKKNNTSFMTIGFESTEKGINETPAVVHVDNSIRPHIFNRKNNEKFYKLIESFNKETGVPVILNTSFNMSGEPIVRTPIEAIKDLVFGKLDYLVMENYLVRRR